MNAAELKDRFVKALTADQGEDRRSFRLSQLSQCPRAQGFAALYDTGAPEDLETLGHYLKGKVWQAFLASLIPEGITEFEVELEGIKGHIDIFVPPDTVLECKATTSSSIPYLPDYNHIWQVKAYMTAVKRVAGSARGILFYVIADNPALSLNHIYEVELTEDEERLLTERAHQLVEEGIPDKPPEYEPDKLPCSGVLYGGFYKCPFFGQCYEEKGEILPVPKTWVDAVGAAVLAPKPPEIDKVGELRKQLEDRMREVLRQYDQIESLKVEGEEFEAEAVREAPYLTFAKGAKDVLIKRFGLDAIRDVLQEVQRVRIVWRRKPKLKEG